MLSNIFASILSMSAAASFVVLVVLVLRLAVNKTGRRFSFALWALVLVRLVCPNLPQSNASVLPQLPQNTAGNTVSIMAPLAFGEGETKGRVKNVLNYKKPAFWGMVLALVALVVAAVCLLTNPAKTPDEPATTIGANARVLAVDAENLRLTVEGLDQNSALGDNCVVTCAEDTFTQLEQDEVLTIHPLSDLAVGDVITLDHAVVLETYPTQTTTRIQRLEQAAADTTTLTEGEPPAVYLPSGLNVWIKPDEDISVLASCAASAYLDTLCQGSTPEGSHITSYTGVQTVVTPVDPAQDYKGRGYSYVVTLEGEVIFEGDVYTISRELYIADGKDGYEIVGAE